jgi:excisionase family DNA binding protein
MENDFHTLSFLTLAEVAELMHVHKRTLLRMIRSKNFPAVMVGGQWRISESQVVQWIESCEIGSDTRDAGYSQ